MLKARCQSQHEQHGTAQTCSDALRAVCDAVNVLHALHRAQEVRLQIVFVVLLAVGHVHQTHCGIREYQILVVEHRGKHWKVVVAGKDKIRQF